MAIPVGQIGNNNSCLLCFVYRDELDRNTWKLVNVSMAG